MAWWSQSEQVSTASQRSRATCMIARNTLELLVAKPGAVLFPETVSRARRMLTHSLRQAATFLFFADVAAAGRANVGELETLHGFNTVCKCRCDR